MALLEQVTMFEAVACLPDLNTSNKWLEDYDICVLMY